MKLAILLFCLAAYVAAQCDPNSDNRPNCAGRANGEISRNFWDPTRYWECQNGNTNVVLCEDVLGVPSGFDPASQKCVLWSEWAWTQPCPDAN
ncbi:hypothetical protein ACLKA6_014084 [Drosophila palustris]